MESRFGSCYRFADEGSRMKATLTRQQLYEMAWTKPLNALAADFGVSGNALAKICDRLLVPYPGRGHWQKVSAGKFQHPPPLPDAPDGIDTEVVISSVRSASRRPRSRMSESDRRRQIVDVTRQIIAASGTHAASMKRVARDAGISEAGIYNLFSSQTELFAFIARDELAQMSLVMQRELQRGTDPIARYALSTLAYLREVKEHGSLVQVLLTLPAVRDTLKKERVDRRSANSKAIGREMEAVYGVPPPIAEGTAAILTAVALRAGKLLTNRKTDLSIAERLTIPTAMASTRKIIATFGCRLTGDAAGQGI
jgi:AcrR family transcriptional regulator